MVGKIVMIILGITVGIVLLTYINHMIQLQKEAKQFTPLGKLVQVDGHNMSVYTEGKGEQTLVFMSGGGTCSPILDFKSLYSLLSDEYRIAVVEKFGYGFSDVVDKERHIVSILEDTRTALQEAEIEGPYILCPHSMSGIEALYWAQQYPEEVSAIIGLDMAVPGAYKEYQINMPMLRLSQFAARIGITRLIPNISESDAIKYGTLSEEEKEIYRAVFYQRTATTTMMNEVNIVKENAKVVEITGVPQVPMLLFVSNGVGTGWDENIWKQLQREYVEKKENAELIELSCPHYIHDHEYELISEKMKEFIIDKL